MSAASVSDVNDRLSALELRVQQQEDELTVMKAALADVLRRLAASEDSAASSTKKQHGGRGKVQVLSLLGPHVQWGSKVPPHLRTCMNVQKETQHRWKMLKRHQLTDEAFLLYVSFALFTL